MCASEYTDCIVVLRYFNEGTRWGMANIIPSNSVSGCGSEQRSDWRVYSITSAEASHRAADAELRGLDVITHQFMHDFMQCVPFAYESKV